MSLDSSSTPIWEIPFPAVTICSENQMRPSIFNYTEVMMRHNHSEKEKNFLQYASSLCLLDLKKKDKLEHINTKYLNEITEKGFAACSSTYVLIGFLQYMWKSDMCSTCLQRRLTPLGTCHTFNSVAFNHMFKETMFHGSQYQTESLRDILEIVWAPDDGYSMKVQTPYPPLRMSGGGKMQGVMFILYFDTNDFSETCSYGGQGFTVDVHNPVELAIPNAVYAKTDHLTEISLMPKKQVTSEELRSWPPDRRGCYYSKERQLQFFQYYTRNNCEMECEANISLATCGCVAMHQPRLESTPVCGAEKESCVISSMMPSSEGVNEDDMCNCLSSCSELEYEIQATSIPLNFSLSEGKQIEGYIGSRPKLKNFAVLRIYFRSRKITAVKRVAVFGITDFIANVGGLMGLFLGFSLLSVFEIFYFLFLRDSTCYCRSTNVRNNNKNQNKHWAHGL